MKHVLFFVAGSGSGGIGAGGCRGVDSLVECFSCLNRSCIRSFVHTFIMSFIDASIHAFVYAFIYSFIGPFIFALVDRVV